MKNVKRAQDLIGNDIYDQEGNRIGRVGNVYVDDSTHQPEWVTVRTGMFGTKESFVPLQGASASERGINVDVSRNKIREAPRVDAEHGHLSDAEGQDLYTYYGLTKPGAESPGADTRVQESADQQSAQAQPTDSQSGHETSSSGQTTGAAAGGAATTGAAAGSSGSGGTGSGSPGTGNRGQYGEATASGGRSRTETSPSAMSGRSGSGSETSGTSSSSGAPADSTTQEESSAQQKSRTQEDARTSWSTQPPREAPRQGSSLDSAEAMPETMTRYEERIRVGTETVETGRVRLRKYIVTEQTSTTVPLTREEVRIEREPIPESERRPSSTGSAEMGESERELVLYEERPIVNTEQIPVERIRINAEKVTEERTVHGDVRKEQFDIDDQTGKHRAPES